MDFGKFLVSGFSYFFPLCWIFFDVELVVEVFLFL